MKLSYLLRLQIIYAIAAILFNLASYLRIKLDLGGLSNTNPIMGVVVIAPIIVAVWAAHRGYKQVFILINSVLVPLLIYAGIIKHISQLCPLPWMSILTSPLALAIAINCFGVTIMTMGLIAILRTYQTGKT